MANLTKDRMVEAVSFRHREAVYKSEASVGSFGTINLYASRSSIKGRHYVDGIIAYDGRPFTFFQDVRRGKTTHTYLATHARNLIYVFNKFYAGAFINDIFHNLFHHLDLGTSQSYNISLSSLSDARSVGIYTSMMKDYKVFGNVFPLPSFTPQDKESMIESLSSLYGDNEVSITVEEFRRDGKDIYFSGSADVKWSQPFDMTAFKFKTHFNGQFSSSRKSLNFSDPVAWTDQKLAQSICASHNLRELPSREFSSMYEKVTETSTFMSAQDGVVFVSILGMGKPFKLKKSPAKAPKLGSPKTDWPMSIVPPKILGTDQKYFDYWVEAMQALQRLEPDLQDWNYDPSQPKEDAPLTYEEAIRWFYQYMRDNYGVLDIISYIRNERSKSRGAKQEIKQLPETIRNQIKIQLDNFYATLAGLRDSIPGLKRSEEFSDQVAEYAKQFFKELDSYNLIKDFGIKTFRLRKNPTVTSSPSWMETMEYSKSLMDEVVKTVKAKAKGQKEAIRSSESVAKLMERAIIFLKQKMGMPVETAAQKSEKKKEAQASIPYRRRELLNTKAGEGMVLNVSVGDKTVTLKMVKDQKNRIIPWDEVTGKVTIPFRRKDIVKDKTSGAESIVNSVRPNTKSVMAIPMTGDDKEPKELKWDDIEFVRH